MKRIVIGIGFVAIGIAIGLGSAYWLNKPKPLTQEQTVVLLESVKDVLRLAVVEGSFLEQSDYTDPNIPYSVFDPWEYQITSLLPRSAHIRVSGKVSVGYDLDSLTMNIDSKNKVVEISNFPAATILSVDHQIEHLDKTDYYFHPFTEADDMRMYNLGKEAIEKAASQSSLFKRADEQRLRTLGSIRKLLESQGWKLEVESKPVPSPLNAEMGMMLPVSKTDSVSVKKSLEKDYDKDIKAIREALKTQ